MIHDHLYRFTRAKRVIKADEFSSAFRLRPTHKTMHFMLHLNTHQTTLARLGVVVPKRLAPRAATRNTVKRIIREQFRLRSLVPADYVIRLFRSINTKVEPATSTQLKVRLHLEINQLLTYVEQNAL